LTPLPPGPRDRLRDCEASGVGNVDVMELVGLYDELARVERKWLEKSQAPPRTGPRARPLADPGQINIRFERLTRLVEASMRYRASVMTLNSAETNLLRRAGEALRTRRPLPT
jgi:hypothetical protein